MRNKILILIGLIILIFFDISFAITVETPVDMSAIGCSGMTCDIAPGEAGFDQIFQGIVKYVTMMASLLGVLYIVVNGIAYSMSGVDESLKSKSKTNIIKMLAGLVLLLLSAMILHIIAPWVY